jgi:hypothetical protein
MELGFKKVVSRWNVRRDTTKVRIMTENSRAEALATIEAHRPNETPFWNQSPAFDSPTKDSRRER